jgi:preprotein translocase subunit SecY
LFKTVANAWKVPEFRKKILFTLFIIVVFRIGSLIPVPFLNQSALANVMNESAADGTALGYLNMLSGGAFASATLFALSITPYINASIIMTLLSATYLFFCLNRFLATTESIRKAVSPMAIEGQHSSQMARCDYSTNNLICMGN